MVNLFIEDVRSGGSGQNDVFLKMWGAVKRESGESPVESNSDSIIRHEMKIPEMGFYIDSVISLNRTNPEEIT